MLELEQTLVVAEQLADTMVAGKPGLPCGVGGYPVGRLRRNRSEEDARADAEQAEREWLADSITAAANGHAIPARPATRNAYPANPIGPVVAPAAKAT
eukprot:4807958-Amphidinium_carterae.1